jgi:hypothetical protein
MGFTRGSGTTINRTHKIPHLAQTKQHTNNKGHLTHNEYNTTKSKGIPATGLGGL